MIPTLSIMLPTTVDRRDSFYILLNEILSQIISLNQQHKVEILIDEDSKQKSIGLKRQHLLERATGEFVVGIDSDDMISETYIYDILAAINNGLVNRVIFDHVGFIEDCDIDGQKSKSIFSIKHKSWDEQEEGYDQVRCANPKSVMRRTKALQVGYKDMRWGEDRIFAESVTPLLQGEIFIEKPLYYYRHTSTNSNERYGIV